MPQLISKLRCGLCAFMRDDTAATAVEYALIGAATSIVLALALDPLRQSPLWGVFQVISDRLGELTNL